MKRRRGNGRRTLVATISINNPAKVKRAEKLSLSINILKQFIKTQMYTIEPCDATEDCHVLLEENDDQERAVVGAHEVEDYELAMDRSELKDLGR